MSHPKGVTFVVHAPAARVGIVIGPGGTTVNNIRRTYQVQIDIPSQRRSKYKASGDRNQVGTVSIKVSGNRNQAQDAVNVIERLIASVHHPSPVEKHRAAIDIPQEYHAELIGRQGKCAKRLEKQYGVRVTFGLSPKDQPCGGSNGTALSYEVSTVSIEGPLAGVEQARDKLIQCYKHIQKKRSALAVGPSLVRVSENAVDDIIGLEGGVLEAIQPETDISIRIRTGEEWALDTATISPVGGPSTIATDTGRIQHIGAEISKEIADKVDIHLKHYRRVKASIIARLQTHVEGA